VLRLGETGQPAPCRSEGALITFRLAASPDVTLLTTFWLERGQTFVLDNFAPPPPSAGPGAPPDSSASPPASDAPAPPAAGTGPSGDAGSRWAAWLVASGVVLALISLGSFWIARRAVPDR
jgi:hypothetical protein